MELIQSSTPLRRSSIDELCARSNLTRRQLLLWVGRKVQGDDPDHNMSSLFIVDGRLDEAAFCRAVHSLVDASDCLRTVIHEQDGVPFQRVLDSFDPQVDVVDLAAHPDPHAALKQEVRQRNRVPFAMERRLARFTLFQMAQSQSAFCIEMHHIVSDGWSVQLAYERLSELYRQALETGRDVPSRPFPRFQDYVAAERAYAGTQEHSDDEAFWADRTRDAEPVSIYGRRVTAASTRARRFRIRLGADRTRRLRALAEASGAFLGRHAVTQNLLAAALYAYVHRVGPGAAPVIALAFHNRPARLQDTMGLLMQALPIRIEVSDDDTFYSLLQKLTDASLQAFEHSRYAVARPLHKRVWEVVLNYLPMQFGRFAGLNAEHERVFSDHSSSALTLTVHDFAGSGDLSIDFDILTEAFAPPNDALAPGHFLALLDAMLADPHTRIHDVDLLSPAEREKLLRRVPGKAPAAMYVHLFEETVRRRDRHPAVRWEGRDWSFAEINARANRLARRLCALGVGPHGVVGIHLRHGVHLVVAVLGVLKAGGCYLPLDASYPTDRLTFMLEDAAAQVVISEKEVTSRLPPEGRQLVLMNDDAEANAELSGDNVPVTAGPDDFAYVIYTSGSTGKPKGVRIQHRALACFLEAVRTSWIDEDDLVACITPLSFDLHIGDLLLPLAVGATLAPIRRETSADARRLEKVLDEVRATAIFATPATFRLLVEGGWQGRKASGRPLKVLCGGEVMPPELAQDLLERVTSLQNIYGPSETTCYVLAHPVKEATSPIPIGSPVPGAGIYVLDKHLQPVPEGMAGELVIGGGQVGFDYLNRPDLTAERFLPDPFSDTRGARMYRSGDLGRRRACIEDDRCIFEYLGRIDQQVKIRGHRIEPGEIESVLCRHPSVRQAVVLAREDMRGDLGLVAWFVGDPGMDGSQLKDFLRRHLPEFMVPSTFVPVVEFPLTPNGKIDRRALPAPARVYVAAEQAEGPRDLLQFQLTKIFEDILDVRRVGIHDSFFDMGGNSMLAVRMLAQLERTINRMPLSLQTLFDSPTPQQLASVLSRDGWQPSLSSVVALQPGGAYAPFFCVHAFIGDVCRDLARYCGSDHPFYGLQPRGLDGREEPLHSIPDMARYYITQMRKVQPNGPYHIGGYSFGGVVAAEMAAQLRDMNEEVAFLAVIDVGPLNMRPRTRRRKAQALVNAPLIALEKVLGVLRDERPAALLGTIRRKLASMTARRRVAGTDAARPGDTRDVLALVDRMYGMAQWPLNYQRIARVNLLASMRYVPRPFDATLTLIRCRAPLHRFTFEDHDWGWSDLVSHVDVHVVDASHDDIMVEPRVRQVGDIIERCLRQRRPSWKSERR